MCQPCSFHSHPLLLIPHPLSPCRQIFQQIGRLLRRDNSPAIWLSGMSDLSDGCSSSISDADSAASLFRASRSTTPAESRLMTNSCPSKLPAVLRGAPGKPRIGVQCGATVRADSPKYLREFVVFRRLSALGRRTAAAAHQSYGKFRSSPWTTRTISPRVAHSPGSAKECSAAAGWSRACDATCPTA